MRQLDHRGVHLSVLLAGAWLIWWFAWRPASDEEMQALVQEMLRTRGEVSTQQFKASLAARPEPTLLAAWSLFAESHENANDDAGLMPTAVPPEPSVELR